MLRPIFQCPLPALILPVLGFPPFCPYDIVFMCIDVFPPPIFRPDGFCTKFPDPSQICFVQKGILCYSRLVKILPVFRLIPNQPSVIIVVHLNFLLRPLIGFRKIVSKVLFRQHDPNQRDFFCIPAIPVYLQKQVLLPCDLLQCRYANILCGVLSNYFRQCQIRDFLNRFSFHAVRLLSQIIFCDDPACRRHSGNSECATAGSDTCCL